MTARRLSLQLSSVFLPHKLRNYLNACSRGLLRNGVLLQGLAAAVGMCEAATTKFSEFLLALHLMVSSIAATERAPVARVSDTSFWRVKALSQ